MTSGAAFKANFAKVLKAAGDKAETFVRASALGLGKSLVERSPVDTGRFKGNWQYGAGGVNGSTSAGTDPSSYGSYGPSDFVGRLDTGLKGWKPGQTIYLTNSLPYARRLEDGWSKQGSGMVRLSVQNLESNVANIAASIK